jgi:formylglycine-generating enzyme required for sulfatase activity
VATEALQAAFTVVPGGSFLMGSDEGQDDERPVHRVWVDAFEMAVYPVTCGAYAAFLAATGHEPPRDWEHFGRIADLPVVGVSWTDADAYCRWSAGEGSPLRLPTEAEWERAARGGVDGRRYPDGHEVPAWLPEGGRGPLDGPWPVTRAPRNAFGIRGIGANVHEWCADWHAADYYARSPDRNPTGPLSGVRRASRGGSWRHAVTISRSAQRSKLDPTFRYTDYGFRVVRLSG